MTGNFSLFTEDPRLSSRRRTTEALLQKTLNSEAPQTGLAALSNILSVGLNSFALDDISGQEGDAQQTQVQDLITALSGGVPGGQPAAPTPAPAAAAPSAQPNFAIPSPGQAGRANPAPQLNLGTPTPQAPLPTQIGLLPQDEIRRRLAVRPFDRPAAAQGAQAPSAPARPGQASAAGEFNALEFAQKNDPRFQIATKVGKNNPQLAVLLITQALSDAAAFGSKARLAGSGSKPTDRDKRIADLLALGLNRGEAIDVADRNEQVVVDQVTGKVFGVNRRTNELREIPITETALGLGGNPPSGAGAGAGGAAGNGQSPPPSTAGAISNPDFDPIGAVAGPLDSFLGFAAGIPGLGALTENLSGGRGAENRQARKFFTTLDREARLALSLNPRFPVAEMEQISKLIPKGGAISREASLIADMQGVIAGLDSALIFADKTLRDSTAPVTARRGASNSVIAINALKDSLQSLLERSNKSGEERDEARDAPLVTTREGRDALPPGTLYRAPDGKLHRTPRGKRKSNFDF